MQCNTYMYQMIITGILKESNLHVLGIFMWKSKVQNWLFQNNFSFEL